MEVEQLSHERWVGVQPDRREETRRDGYGSMTDKDKNRV